MVNAAPSGASSTPASRKSVLLAHPFLGNGGSECATVWILQALRDEYDVTLCTASAVDLPALNRHYGTDLKQGDFRHLPAPRLPLRGAQAVALQFALFDRFSRRVAHRYDVCFSAYNFVGFGRPAIQRVADFSFDEDVLAAVNPAAGDHLTGGGTWLREAYRAACGLFRGRSVVSDTDPRDVLVANSRWTSGVVERHLGRNAKEVLYPPLPPSSPVTGARNPGGFVMLGRVSPEKRVEVAIEILEAVRAKGYEVMLTVAGPVPADRYGESVRAAASSRPWVMLAGRLDLAAKAVALASATYGIHACEGEAFGIAVAEMMTAGLVTFVPSSGGVAELAPDDSLQYDGVQDAVGKIVAHLESASLREESMRATAEKSKAFSTEMFVEGVRELVRRFADGRPGA